MRIVHENTNKNAAHFEKMFSLSYEWEKHFFGRRFKYIQIVTCKFKRPRNHVTITF